MYLIVLYACPFLRSQKENTKIKVKFFIRLFF